MAKILVIEDSVFYRKAITSALTHEGFQTCAAGTGEEGLRVAQTEQPALILLDMMMPRLDGMMVLRMLRGMPQTKMIPVIVMSGQHRAEDVQAAKALKVVDYCAKESITADQLVQSVRKALAN